MPDRLVVVALLIALVGAAFILRLFQLQILEGAEHAQAVERSLVVIEPLTPKRGRILDRTGAPMAETKPIYHLSVVLAELEPEGRARREQELWQLDQRRFDALVGDLTTRLHWINHARSLRDVLLEEFLAEPGTAVRLGRRTADAPVALVAIERRLLAPGSGDEEAVSRLVEGDLLFEDPRDAIAREIAARWGVDAEVATEADLADACTELDHELDLHGDRSYTVLDPFADRCQADIPGGGGRSEPMQLRLLMAERRDQAEVTLARTLGAEVEVVRDRLARALVRTRHPPPDSPWYFAAATDADQIAPLLPAEAHLHEVPLPGVVGTRERVLILQGDPPGDEGLFSRLCRRLAASLDWRDPGLLQAVIESHAERILPITSARQHRSYHLVLDPAKLAHLVDGLAARLTAEGIPTSSLDVEARIADARRLADRELAGRTRRDAIPLFQDVPHAVAVRMVGAGSQPPDSLRRQYEGSDATLPGLTVTRDIGRSYPCPGAAPNIIGMLARSADGPEALHGISGLELRYDEILRGVPGGRMRVRTPDGFVTLRDNPPLPGADLVTEVDLELQMLAEDSLSRYLELARNLGIDTERKMDAAAKIGHGQGGMVLLDCRTGGILVLASNPTYRIDEVRDNWQKLLHDPAQPLIDHAAVADMPPGSSFKILTALCALENGVMVPGEQVWCQGFMAMSHGRPVLRDHAPAGTYDLAEAIQVSSNVYFATMADRLAKRVGPGVLPAYALRVGVGRENALDVASQRVGPYALPTPDSIARLRPHEPSWYPSDNWRMGIGQNCQAAPLNVAPIAAAVANGGHVVSPFLVRPGSGPVVSDLGVRKAFLEDVRHGMEKVTAPGGTASRLVLEGEAAGIKVAAKTGTSEWGRKEPLDPDNGWLIGYAPADRPTVAFACYVHCGTFGGNACVPVVKRVLERYFAKYGREGHRPAGAPAE